MEDFLINRIFKKIVANPEFQNIYFTAFLDKFVYAATDLETELSKKSRKQAIEDLLTAFTYLIDFEGKMTPSDFVDVGNIINAVSGIEGFRKINVSAGNYAEWIPIPANKIYYSLYILLDNYYNVWNERDIYEKEAAFHISLMRIHPFEDGNKRVAKLVMDANFVKQNYPPVIITEGETELYYKFINEEDVMGFAKFLKAKSLDELSNIMGYYKTLNKIPITDSLVDEAEEQNDIGEDLKARGRK